MPRLINQYSRISHHTLTTTGSTAFSVPATEDFSQGTWTPTDLALSEIGVKEGTDQAFIRIGSTIHEFMFIDSNTTFEKTYAELVDEVASSGLTGGASYLLTDFQTIYDRPDYSGSSTTPAPVILTVTASTEPLVLRAISPTQFDPRVVSTLFPDDIIHYNFDYDSTYVNSTPAKGRITYRKDSNGNVTDFDHRNVTFKRYDRSGNGVYNYIWNSGSDNSSFLSPIAISTSFNVRFGDCVKLMEHNAQAFNLPNNVIGGNSDNVSFGSYVRDNHFGTTYTNCSFGHNYVRNRFGNTYGSCNFDHSYTNNDFGNTYTNCSFGDTYTDNVFESNYNGSNTFGSNYLSNIFGGSFADNTFGNSYDGNTFVDIFGDNNFGNDWRNNYLGGNYSRNIFGSFYVNNTFGANYYTNTFSSYYISNTFGVTYTTNIFGHRFSGNTFGDNYGDFGVNRRSNTFGSDYQGNIFGNSYRDNTFGSSYEDNVFGYNLRWNDLGNDYDDNDFISSNSGVTFVHNSIGHRCANNSFSGATENCTIGTFFQSNSIASTFKSNVISSVFTNNIITSGVTQMECNVNPGLSSTDFTSATVIYGDYYKKFIRSSDGNIKLWTIDDAGVSTMNVPTA